MNREMIRFDNEIGKAVFRNAANPSKPEDESAGSARPPANCFEIDAESVAAYRRELRAMAKSRPVAQEAIEHFSDWEVVQAMERLWAVAMADDEDDKTALRQRDSRSDP